MDHEREQAIQHERDMKTKEIAQVKEDHEHMIQTLNSNFDKQVEKT